MSAGENLAHLNHLLDGLERPRRMAARSRWEEEEYDEEEYDSEDDYELNDDAIALLAPVESEVTVEAIQNVWKEQRGTCAVSGLCIDPTSGGMYGPAVAQKHFSRPLSNENVIIVTRAVARMREAVDLPWTSFRAVLKQTSMGASEE